jgi:nucleoside-diphosphate-sugar epimerase
MAAFHQVFVTGSSGQLGREVVQLLRGRGYQVIGADLLPAPTTDLLLDIRDAQAVLEATRGLDAIIHTAALHGKQVELGYPRLAFVQTNIEGTLHLLNACIRHGIRKFLYTSTTSIYGNAMVDANQAVWVDENLAPQPRDIYDITKQAAEALCRDFFEKEGLETVVLRVACFLPEEENLKVNYRFYRGLDERDGALGHLLALEHPFTSFETFNISGGSPFTRADLGLLKKLPEQVITQRLPLAAAAYQHLGWHFPTSIDRVYSIEKAQRILGYAPRYTAEYLLGQALTGGS